MGWHVDECASSHIHVDASDFTPKDRAKLMMFNSLLKEIPFMLVSPSRFGNRYCRTIETAWDTVFEDERINWDTACSGTYGSLRSYLNNHNLSNTYPIEKYQWTNIHTNYSTVEFRIFNGVTTEEEIRNFAAIAHNTVELVKHTSVEQLQFIVAEIWQSTSVDELLGKYLQAISIEENIPIICTQAINTVEQKLNRPKRYSKMLSEISISRAN
ncbi:putative amidoligase enzyme [compost metagenome]